MNKVSIIGATSPLGITLVDALKDAGSTVHGNFRNRELVPAAWNKDPQIMLHNLDLLDDFNSTPFACETVVWLAHIDAGRSNDREIEVNLNAFERFLDTLRKSTTQKIVFVSSGGSVYGHPEILPISENHPREPLSTYGKTKRALEDRLTAFGRSSGIHTAVLRPGNIYGFERPDRKSKGVTGAFLRSLAHGSPFTLIHSGRTVRDFIHVDDVCTAVISAIRSDMKEIVWNVATGIGTSTIEVLQRIIDHTDAEMPELIAHENFETDVLENVLCVQRIKAEAGWTPSFDLDAGIARTIELWETEKQFSTNR